MQRKYLEFPVHHVHQVMQRQGVVGALDPAGCNLDQLRVIRGQLQLGWCSQKKTLLLTGPVGREGTSTIAAGLACMFAELNWRTLLIDANLRAPSLHKLFGLSNQFGLANMLANYSNDLQPQSVLQVEPLSVLVAGPTPENPAELLSREEPLSHILDIGVACNDVVLIDGPCSISPEFQVLAALCAGVMIVAQKGSTHFDAVRTLKNRVQRAGAQVVGAVLNDH